MFRFTLKGIGGVFQYPLWVSCLAHLTILTSLFFYGIPIPSDRSAGEAIWIQVGAPSKPVERVNAVVRKVPQHSPEAATLIQDSVPEVVASVAPSLKTGDPETPVEDQEARRQEAEPVLKTGEEPEAERASALPTDETDEDFSRFREAILDRIGKNKTYPLLARKRGMEGEVYLKFHVRADGFVGDITANHKTGQLTVLEQAAVRLIRDTAPFGPVPLSLLPGGATVDLVISYHLEETDDGGRRR